MKKGTIIALIVAGALLLLGCVLVSLGFSFVGGWPDTTAPAEKTYVVNEPFTSIQVDTTVCDVTFVRTGGEFQAVCPDSETLSYTVTVEDGTLCVRQVDLRKWYDFIGINLDKQEIILYLPDNQYDTLYIQSSTGDIFVPKDFSFTAVTLSTSTGDMDFSAAITEQLTASASTGDITIQGSSPAIAQISTRSGDVALQDMACRECFVTTTTGKITMANVTCQTLDCQSDTGDKNLQNVVAGQSLKAISTTGDVELVGCDAPMLTIETDTGDIEGILLSPKEFFTYTNTGDVRIPNHNGTVNGQCYVNSDTGDITFSYQP